MKKLIMLEFLTHKDKKIILLILVVIILIFSFLYLILNLQSLSKMNSEFITRSAAQLSKDISYSVYSKNYSLIQSTIKESQLLEFINFIEIKDINSNKVPLNIEKKHLEEKCCKNILYEPIYYKSKMIGKLSYCTPNIFFSNIEKNIINFLILSLLILTLIMIIIFSIRSKIITKQHENETNQIQPFISHLSKLFSHDFRKPFNLLKMLLINIKKSKNNQSEINELNNMIISEIEKNISRVDSLIHDIIELGSETKLNNEILDLKPIIENIISSTILSSEINKLKLNLCINNTGKINIDLLKFNKIIFTVISYTIRNCTNQESIWIKTGNINIKNKSFIYIKIGNKTSYIHKREVECVFNLFYNNEIKGNSGLELAICKKITELHNGFIKCNSSKLTGTEFVISLPSYNC